MSVPDPVTPPLALLPLFQDLTGSSMPNEMTPPSLSVVEECLATHPSCILERTSNHENALHLAVKIKAMGLSTLQLLLDSGIDIHETTRDGFTAVMLAGLFGHTNLIHFLVKHGALPHGRDRNGFALLHRSAMIGSLQMTRYCVEALGLEVAITDDSGRTPLMFAAMNGHLHVLKYLLLRGGSPHRSDQEGKTALHWAAYGCSAKCCEALMKAGGDVTSLSHDGSSLADFAKASTHDNASTATRFFQFLISHPRLHREGRAHYIPYFTWIPFVFFPGLIAIFALAPSFWTASLFCVGLLVALRQLFLFYFPSIHETRALVGVCYSWPLYSFIFALLYLTGKPLSFFVLIGLLSTFVYHYHQLVGSSAGVVEKDTLSIQDVIRAYESESGMEICFTCMARKPLRSKHSPNTGDCVPRFDHFCPWIGGDVGVLNFRYFIVVYFIGSLAMFSFLYCGYGYLIETIGPEVRASVAFYQLPSTFYVAAPAFSTVMFIQVCFFLFCSMIVGTGFRSCLQNMTTNELINAKKYSHFWVNKNNPLSHDGPDTDLIFKNPFDLGMYSNVREFLLNPTEGFKKRDWTRIYSCEDLS